MKYHGVMILRDEEDIIEECLTSMLEWIDGVYILDLGSSDATWEIVQKMAKSDSRIVPFEKKPYVFSNALRGYVFERFRDRMRDGDWVLRVDADEFYEIPPPEFVRHHLKPAETSVFLQWYYFRLTSEEVQKYESGEVSLLEDRAKSILLRRRFYKIPLYSEPRMFRYRASMKWSPAGSFPTLAGRIAEKRIPIRHYPHRDPLQMAARYALRFNTYRDTQFKSEMPHWSTDDWRTDLLHLHGESGEWREAGLGVNGLTAAPDHTSGEVMKWDPGEPLPTIHCRSHLPTGRRKLAQKLIYPALVRLLDNFQPGWPDGYVPPLTAPAASAASML